MKGKLDARSATIDLSLLAAMGLAEARTAGSRSRTGDDLDPCHSAEGSRLNRIGELPQGRNWGDLDRGPGA